MKNTHVEAVKAICEKVYQGNYNQIIIDLVQEEIEELTEADKVSRDDIGALEYQCSILLEVYNPRFSNDTQFLEDMIKALKAWTADHENTNRLLGLPIED